MMFFELMADSVALLYVQSPTFAIIVLLRDPLAGGVVEDDLLLGQPPP